MTPRFAISGVGVAAPTGIGVGAHWKNTLGRRGGLRRIAPEVHGGTGLRVAGSVPDFRPEEFVSPQIRVQTDRWTWLGMAAAELALADAALPEPDADRSRLAVLTAAATGGNEFGQREIHALWGKGPRAVSVYQSIGWFYAALCGQTSIRHGVTGRCGVTVAEGAGGLQAAAAALRLLRRGGADHVLLGAAEAPLSPFALVCHQHDTLSTGAEPAAAYLPFTRRARGGVLGEGAAMVVVEDADLARRRGAQVYAELAAVASTHDAHHPEEPPPDAGRLVAAVRSALDRADVVPSQVDVVFADASGDPRWDRLEIEALEAVFGTAAAPPVAVPKTLTGRLNSAGALLDLSWAALSLFHDVIPPAADGLDGIPFRGALDVVRTPRRDTGLGTALVIARGAGGFNAAAVLHAPGGHR
ncbi:ketosynthase chain-length factor [Actinomadura meridiana]|uniref:Ketosynthase chain-length factor n=1 Tax=Actinomadura meridiana TaxID=559626 RepID=A0ABP8C4H7_9ACTN